MALAAHSLAIAAKLGRRTATRVGATVVRGATRGARWRVRAIRRSARAGARGFRLGRRLGGRARALSGPAAAPAAVRLARARRAGGAAGFFSGAAAMYMLDPQSGRRRRHVARDRALKLARREGRRIAKETRHGEHSAAGALHVIRRERAGGPRPAPDDVTLAREVESAIHRAAGAPKGAVLVNAEQGMVYLRGEVPSAEVSEQVAAWARSVPGARGVKNLLHLPGEPARTAEDVRGTS